jgi:hypothetical protein
MQNTKAAYIVSMNKIPEYLLYLVY